MNLDVNNKGYGVYEGRTCLIPLLGDDTMLGFYV